MALIKCSECGIDIPENSKFCLNCGRKINVIEKEIEAETEKEEAVIENFTEQPNISLRQITRNNESINFTKEKRTKKLLIIGIIIATGYVILSILESTIFDEIRHYNQAISYIESKDYANAISILKELDYKDSKDLLNKSEENYSEQQYNQAISYINENKLDSLISAETILSKLNIGYKNRDSLLEKCIIEIGNNYFTTNEFDNALSYYNKLEITQKEKIKENLESINFYNEIQGEWLNSDSTEGIKIEKNEIILFQFSKTSNGKKIYVSTRNSGEFKMIDIINHEDIYPFFPDFGEKAKISLENGSLFLTIDSINRKFSYSKMNFSDDLATKPKIGMTKEEVLDSTWGQPEEINKDTYEWGVNEQWCYPNYKYVFIEDGIVTSISE